VAQAGATRTLEFRLNGIITTGPVLTNDLLWLKSTWGLEGQSRYAYSSDGTTFTPFGETYQLGWGFYRGDRIGIYNLNNRSESGWVDVDWFHYDYAGPMTATHNAP